MDIFEHLESEHRTVEELFDQILEKGKNKKLVNDLHLNLAAHVKTEEKILYKRLEGEKDVRERILEAYEEHRAASRLLGELMRTDDKEHFRAKVSVLKELVAHHVQEEEQTLFPKVRGSIISEDEAQQLNERYETAESKEMANLKKAA